VDEQISGFALSWCSTTPTSSTIGLNLRACCTTNAEMAVPEPNSAW
jgi:hypothetical protein